MTDLKPARILAIETSGDETACAVIENGRELLASTVASQMEVHARFGIPCRLPTGAQRVQHQQKS